MRLSSIECLGGFAEAAGETVVDEGELEGAFESFVDGLTGVLRCESGGSFIVGRGFLRNRLTI